VGLSPAVADVATGTGVWLRSLAAELPTSARLDGFDFDVSKFPDDPAMVTPNMTLSYVNMLEPFPEEMHGVYDLVHLRLVKFGVKADQWTPLAENILKLLKPGGWLLWDEMSYSSWIAVPVTQNFFDWISAEVRYAVSVGRDPKYVRPPLSYIGS
jgi:SAM-dependent methyltransferase